jgi:hypothetical protein
MILNDSSHRDSLEGLYEFGDELGRYFLSSDFFPTLKRYALARVLPPP